jgi:hypothetical protein
MKKSTLFICILAACSGTAFAADDTAAPKAAVPTISDMLDASGVAVTGYLDVAYNKMNSTGLQAGGAASRIFDTPGATSTQTFSNFNLQQAAVIISKAPKEGFGGLVNLTAGQDAPGIAATGLGLGDANHYLDLTQAYASYATGPVTVIGGKYATLAGAELITSPSNKNYSRAWMFGWGPYTHTGMRATYVASDMFTLIGGVNNGWDQVSQIQGTSGKTGELGFILTPSPMFSLATTYLNGKEGSTQGLTTGGTIGTRSYLDVIGTINATDKLNFVADYANGSQKNVTLAGLAAPIEAKWNALALYANYQFTDVWRASYRHEGFDDKNGFRSGLLIGGVATGQKLTSNTLTVGYAVDKKLELRGEVRFDKSTQTAFQLSNGGLSNTQHSYALEAIYQF